MTQILADNDTLDSNKEKTVCFHCGLEVSESSNFAVEIDGIMRPMCCRGCQAVATTIVENGLEDYYRYRDRNALTGHDVIPDVLAQLSIYDNPDVQKSFVTQTDDHIKEASLILEGIVCAACVWLNEQHIAKLDGVIAVQINYSTHRARVQWDDRKIKLSEILQAISNIGYLAHPYDPDRQQSVLEKQRKGLLKRIGVAAGFGMQVMIIAVALYAGAFSGMDVSMLQFFYWVSLLLTIPVLLYSAQPFFMAAWRDISHKQAGMDVPVTLGISLAFAGSAISTFLGHGEVYFDSVVMFVFFLLTARYMEMAARARASSVQETLVHMTPAYCNRVKTARNEVVDEQIAIAELQVNDEVLVRPGETIPADGVIVEGSSSVNEALLSGESWPQRKQSGDRVIGGSINYESPLRMQISKTGSDTVLSGILRLLERAQSEKPRITILADRGARYFVAAVLILALLVAAYYWGSDPHKALLSTLAVLVVTCPCALSLATPTAITAATGQLTTQGVLVTRGHALEILSRATHVIFDKTGTLTRGELAIQNVYVQHNALSKEQCLALAAALEVSSEHPIAKAFRDSNATKLCARTA